MMKECLNEERERAKEMYPRPPSFIRIHPGCTAKGGLSEGEGKKNRFDLTQTYDAIKARAYSIRIETRHGLIHITSQHNRPTPESIAHPPSLTSPFTL